MLLLLGSVGVPCEGSEGEPLDDHVRGVLERGTRCLLALRGLRGPVIAPLAFWFDGTSAWTQAPTGSGAVEVLSREPACALAVHAPGEDELGAIARGRARVFSLRDPLGLALHGPTLSAAMGALAVRNLGSIAASVQGAARAPSRLRPSNRVVVRVTLDEVASAPAPGIPPGIAPALPTVLPPDVRRALAGRRRVLVAVEEPGARTPILTPAVWGAGFSLAVAGGWRPPAGTRAAVALDGDGRGRSAQVLGLALAGTLSASDPPALRPERATWWRGFTVEGADVPAPAARGPAGTPLGAITLPD